MRRAESRETEPMRGMELNAHGGVQPAALPAPQQCHFALFLPVIKKAGD